MANNETIVAGIVIPSDSPFFLAVVGLHILVALFASSLALSLC
jgi:hypothetical protein